MYYGGLPCAGCKVLLLNKNMNPVRKLKIQEDAHGPYVQCWRCMARVSLNAPEDAWILVRFDSNYGRQPPQWLSQGDGELVRLNRFLRTQDDA